MDAKTKNRIADEVMEAVEKSFSVLPGCQVYGVSVLYMPASGGEPHGFQTFTVMPSGTPSLRAALQKLPMLGRMALKAEVVKAMHAAGSHTVAAFSKLLGLPTE